MFIKKNSNVGLIFFVLLIFVGLLFITGTIPFSLVASDLAGEKVYIPKYGSLSCEKGTQLGGSAGILISSSAPNVEQRSFSAGGYGGTVDSIISSVLAKFPQYGKANNPYFLETTYSCNAAQCDVLDFLETDFTCNSVPAVIGFLSVQTKPIWKISIGGQVQENTTRGTGLVLNGDLTKNFSLKQGETITIDAVCVDSPSANYVYKPGINKRVTGYNANLYLYADGTKFLQPGTDNCLKSDVVLNNPSISSEPVTAIEGQPTSKKTFYNVAGVINNSYVLPNELGSLSIGQTYPIILWWQTIDGINVQQLSDSTKVFALNTGIRTVYKVEKQLLSNGNYINIIGGIYKQNVQCIADGDCSTGNYCKTIDGSFTCVNVVTEPPQCTFDSQCPSTVYQNINGVPTLVSYHCASSKCVMSKQTLTCNPTLGYPANGCPSNATRCNYNGTQCTAESPIKQNCPSGACCIGSTLYYDAGCPTNFFCVNVNSVGVGECKGQAPIKTEICNNGIDDDADGKIDLEDTDCGQQPIVCENKRADGFFVLGYTTATKEVPQYLLGFIPIQIGTIKVSECVPVYNILMIILVTIGTLVILFLMLERIGVFKKRRGR